MRASQWSRAWAQTGLASGSVLARVSRGKGQFQDAAPCAHGYLPPEWLCPEPTANPAPLGVRSPRPHTCIGVAATGPSSVPSCHFSAPTSHPALCTSSLPSTLIWKFGTVPLSERAQGNSPGSAGLAVGEPGTCGLWWCSLVHGGLQGYSGCIQSGTCLPRAPPPNSRAGNTSPRTEERKTSKG